MADAAIQPFEVRNAGCGMRKKTNSRGAAEIYKLEMINRKSEMGDVADQANGHLKTLVFGRPACWDCSYIRIAATLEMLLPSGLVPPCGTTCLLEGRACESVNQVPGLRVVPKVLLAMAT